MSRITRLCIAVVLVYLATACADTTPTDVPDGGGECDTSQDCWEGYICLGGSCVEKPECTDLDQDSYCDEKEDCANCLDCNDNRSDIYPGADEKCDNQDNDCDGETDEGFECRNLQEKPCGSSVGICEKGTSVCENCEWGPCTGGVEPEPEEDCSDNLDNDCSGSVNDGCACEAQETRPCGTSVGECTPGVQNCIEDGGQWVWSGCTGGTPPEDEICGDDADNDCDGSIDNGCICQEGDRRPCGLNVGICHAGRQDCEHDVWGPCYGAGMPEEEICDGLDNDCDRIIDEGCECINGIFGPCGDDTGECRMGTRICDHGEWGECEGMVGPTTEICDGKDNDCSGEADEEFPDLREYCEAGTGVCTRPGIMVCNAAQDGTRCSATPGTGHQEYCDGLDNDCDGSTDEDFPDVGGACTVGIGECTNHGVLVCGSHGGVICNAQPLPREEELCDGLDNDCDGFTDEDFYLLGTGCIEGLGECRTAGTMICKADGSGTECDANPPVGIAELCDFLDNDCDGTTDEDFIPPLGDLGETCQVGLGVCTRLGIKVCSSNMTATVCSATPGTGSPEICDMFDNDCDGSTNEDIPGTGGPCSIGQGACQSSGTMVCVPQTGQIVCNAQVIEPIDELCDDRDNDCDGFTDENFGLLGVACAVGVGECRESGVYVCSSNQLGTVCDATPGTPTAEICDGLDNSCDGTTDEDFADLGDSCTVGQGVCTRLGIKVCHASGTTTECNATPGSPSPEVCDGLDNNCDGPVDNGVPGTGVYCEIGLGACLSSGTTECGAAGDIICNATIIDPTAELCDGIDNDCNGFTDEPFGQLNLPCSAGIGECVTHGIYVCSADQTGTECNAVPDDPVDELCDGLDNNCNSLIDDGYVVPCSTACGDGYIFCVGGVETACSAMQPLPDDSYCDGFDGDCDGNTDEDVACEMIGGEMKCLGDLCDTGQGLCYSTGYVVCNATGGIRCNAVAGAPQYEGGSSCQDGNCTCFDLVDNDCDGAVDCADTQCNCKNR